MTRGDSKVCSRDKLSCAEAQASQGSTMSTDSLFFPSSASKESPHSVPGTTSLFTKQLTYDDEDDMMDSYDCAEAWAALEED
ncbi:hypothetical protein CCR75_004144 [Bremia lactucae]|uniref:Uncharacterized protein n=1 Tax=Bremia lactucae TaxID=4779 RepID=A0A976ICV4_BRELC|nr:hypothetical protein CCR75_004144 [Bremia lactucae]